MLLKSALRPRADWLTHQFIFSSAAPLGGCFIPNLSFLCPPSVISSRLPRVVVSLPCFLQTLKLFCVVFALYLCSFLFAKKTLQKMMHLPEPDHTFCKPTSLCVLIVLHLNYDDCTIFSCDPPSHLCLFGSFSSSSSSCPFVQWCNSSVLWYLSLCASPLCSSPRRWCHSTSCEECGEGRWALIPSCRGEVWTPSPDKAPIISLC